MTVNAEARSNSEPDRPGSSRRAASHNATAVVDYENNSKRTIEPPRPGISKYATERPKPTASASLMSPGIQRQATNTSLLNEAIWRAGRHNADDSSSSSSSSSSEDEGEAPSTGAKQGSHKSKGGRRASSGLKRGQFSRFNVGNDDFSTRGKVSRKDGRLNISVKETNNTGYLAKALGASFLKNLSGADATDKEEPKIQEGDVDDGRDIKRPKLSIVVMVIGSRGDIQPFLKLGKNLKEYGHRVRIATHPAFKEFVEKDSGLEFFSVGGDPAELMAFMVKNPGMIPTMETLRKGEVGRRRDQMAEMFEGFWRACINATDDEKDINNLKMMGKKAPFVADAIIANPPSFAHIHCAERLGIPLHLMFTFPYTPTQAFPHPLANIKKSNVDPGYTNFMSYPLVEMMTWQGLGDLVNNFRVKTLGLEPVSTLWAPGQLYRLKVPYTYLWSPGLVPKPKDWGPEIDIAGFVFLDLASSFEPPDDLTKFLEGGESPVYIGFGSIVVDDPDKFTQMIFEAVEKAGVRALVSKGWGGLGDDNVPENIFMLENTPHDWLFPKVSAVVHHGGAGTTAIGLKCGKPTMIVPFFGDQQFWGNMIGESGAGADPVPYKKLTADKLADGIKQCLGEDSRKGAAEIAKRIEEEGDGAENAVRSFHRSLVLRGPHSLRCSILEDRVAVWFLKNTNLRLSALAAEILVEKKKLTWKRLRLIRHNQWNDFEGPGEPITGAGTAIMSTVTDVATGVGSVPFRIVKKSKKRIQHEKKKKRHSLRHQKSDQADGHDTTSGSETKSDQKEKAKPNGRVAKGKGTGDDIAKATEKSNRKVELKNQEALEALRKSQDTQRSSDGVQKIIDRPALGGHTVSGEPVEEKDRAVKEEQKEHEHAKKEDNGGNETDVVSMLSADPVDNAATEMVNDVGEGVGKTAEALARAPMDLALAISQGFHNAPRLYGDETVRKPTRITGYRSGLKAAREEFAYGIYDGWTGVVTQPYRGARNEGAIGFVKGTGMGLTGFVLKNISAIVGPFGYTLKGFHKELLKSHQPTHFIRKARILEGTRDLNDLNEAERKKAYEAVEHGWKVIQEIWRSMQETEKQGGVVGKIKVRQAKKEWKAHGAFENVEMAERALEAKKHGNEGELSEVFDREDKQKALAKQPRKKVVDELKENNEAGNRGTNSAG